MSIVAKRSPIPATAELQHRHHQIRFNSRFSGEPGSANSPLISGRQSLEISYTLRAARLLSFGNSNKALKGMSVSHVNICVRGSTFIQCPLLCQRCIIACTLRLLLELLT